MKIISRKPLIVETLYDGVFKVKVALSKILDNKLIEYIEKHDLQEGTDVNEHLSSNRRLDYTFSLLNPEE